MQDAVWNEICEHYDLSNDEDKKKFLVDLKPHVRELRKAFSPIEVDPNYCNKEYFDICYLLRYFPTYSQLISYFLSSINFNVNIFLKEGKNVLRISFFCSGAAPESYGLSKFLLNSCEELIYIDSIFLDKNLEQWERARNICVDFTEKMAEQSFPPARYENINNINLDFNCDVNDEVLEIVSESDILVFQNCLNELDTEIFQENLKKVYFSMNSDACLVLLDRSNYSSNMSVMDEVLQFVEEEGGYVYDSQEIVFDCRQLNDEMPSIIKENLFYGISTYYDDHDGLILAKDLRYRAILISKSELPLSIDE
ncbi:hypothetical protein [Acinetobacter sp. TR11]|uniref:hypothetical protein n=1 Tax=Acinetobacter sp. TR11 TaxID=3003393 RepID=UPI0022AC592C|nr:hypothetical protein [Acinetobacter sp. TR11]WAU74444.1 hypothetical protein O1450_04925 [Acinetobacter sp. TR11]